MYKNQTNKMLAQDGVLQKGGTVDPVSGNDVPPGAMPEEVRDDVDAKLSEGEFVVPADVVRYIGLAKLMEMRDEAKRGLQKMTDIGQMGNSKKGAEGEALHGEEGEEEFASSIDEIMNEEEGGEEETPEYAQGGYVPRSSGYDPAESVALYSRAPIKGFEMIPMSNDTGNTIYIPFINGKPQLQIPPGYVIKAKAAAEAAAPVAPTAGGTGTTAAQGGEGGQDFGGPTGDTGGLPPASDRTDFRSAVLSIPNIMKGIPYVGPFVTAAKTWAEKAAAADKAYLSPFEAPMVAAREAFTKSERSAAISKAIDNSITNNTDPIAELETIVADMFAAPAPVASATPVAQSILGAGTALSPLASEAEAKAAAAQEARETANREAAAQSAREAAAAQEAREAANREAAAQSAREAAAQAAQEARETANREAAAQSARETAAAIARDTNIAGSVSGDGGYGGFGGETGGAQGFGGEYAKGGMVTKKDKGFVSSRQHNKNKRTGFVAKK